VYISTPRDPSKIHHSGRSLQLQSHSHSHLLAAKIQTLFPQLLNLIGSCNGVHRQDGHCSASFARRLLELPLRRRPGRPPLPPPHQAHGAQLRAPAVRPRSGPGEREAARAFAARAARVSPGPTAVVVGLGRLPDAWHRLAGASTGPRGGRGRLRVRRRQGLRRRRGRRDGRHRRHQDRVGHRVPGRRGQRRARRRRLLVPRALHRLHRPVPGERHDSGWQPMPAAVEK